MTLTAPLVLVTAVVTAPLESSVRVWPPVASVAPPRTSFLKVERVPEEAAEAFRALEIPLSSAAALAGAAIYSELRRRNQPVGHARKICGRKIMRWQGRERRWHVLPSRTARSFPRNASW